MNGRRSRRSTTERGYGWQYQQARERLLRNNPRCHWCGAPATTADHVPPMAVAGPHLNLVPACGPCNYGRRNGFGGGRDTPPRRSRVW